MTLPKALLLLAAALLLLAAALYRTAPQPARYQLITDPNGVAIFDTATGKLYLHHHTNGWQTLQRP